MNDGPILKSYSESHGDLSNFSGKKNLDLKKRRLFFLEVLPFLDRV